MKTNFNSTANHARVLKAAGAAFEQNLLNPVQFERMTRSTISPFETSVAKMISNRLDEVAQAGTGQVTPENQKVAHELKDALSEKFAHQGTLSGMMTTLKDLVLDAPSLAADALFPLEAGESEDPLSLKHLPDAPEASQDQS